MTQEEIMERIRGMFDSMYDSGKRRVRIQTGPGGMDLFNEVMEKNCGFERVYTNKIPRFAKIFNWRTSCTGRKYRLLKASI